MENWFHQLGFDFLTDFHPNLSIDCYLCFYDYDNLSNQIGSTHAHSNFIWNVLIFYDIFKIKRIEQLLDSQTLELGSQFGHSHNGQFRLYSAFSRQRSENCSEIRRSPCSLSSHRVELVGQVRCALHHLAELGQPVEIVRLSPILAAFCQPTVRIESFRRVRTSLYRHELFSNWSSPGYCPLALNSIISYWDLLSLMNNYN